MADGNKTIEVCINLPPKVNSNGIWESLATPSAIFRYSLPRLEIQIVLAFFVTHLVYAILKPLGITMFSAQMFAGIILGPGVLGKIKAFDDILDTHSQRKKDITSTAESSSQCIDTLAVFGFVLFLFLMGVKMDVLVAFRTTKRAIVIGLVSFLSPFLVCFLGFKALVKHNQTDQKLGRLGVTSIEAFTSFSVIAWLLHELKIVNSELGRLALSSAAVNTLFQMLSANMISFYQRWQLSAVWAIVHLGLTLVFVFFLLFVFRPLMFWIIKTTPEGTPIHEMHIMGIVMAALGCALYTTGLNNTPFFGAFLCGLAVPDGPPLGSALIDKFECFVTGVFLTVYVTTSTMHLDPTHIASNLFILVLPLVVVAFFAKFLSCFVVSVQSMMPWRDSLAFSLIMSSKGIVELSHYHNFRDQQLISEDKFSVLAFIVLLNATLIPVLVKFLYNPASRKHAGYEKRNLMHLKPESELRILACIHKPENVPALIYLLDLTFPTEESHVVIYALHLIELMGRDSPIFISHQWQEDRAASSFEHSLLFNQYEQKHDGLVTVNTFTAISPPRSMHEDIICMTLDKQIPFVILPYHRNWSMDGSIDVEDKALRNLNISILDQASCSIGILVDRGLIDTRRKPLGPSTPCCIAMLFLGGKDDWEALTLARRMARNPCVKLTVIQIVADQDSKTAMDWDTMLDAEMLKDIKQNEVGDGCGMTYVAEVSNNGPQTATIVKSVANYYDVIIVGRRYGVDRVQTEGLSEWTEFPELGIVGDLLASTDLDSRATVLIVQQQHYIDIARY